MAKRYLVNAIAGTLAERPDPSTPSGGASESPFGLYLDTGTGDIYESTGSAWAKIGTLTGSGGGSITDATTSAIGGVEVDHARSGAHSVALTTDGLALPAGMIGTASTKAAAGNDARLSDARTPTAHAATHVDGGGDVVYPGVTGDGQTPGGINVAGAASLAGGSFSVNSSGYIIGGLGVRSDGLGENLLVLQEANFQTAMSVDPNGSITVNDVTSAATFLLKLQVANVTRFQVGSAGGMGLFGHAAPTTPQTLAQSVITAITDTNAQTAVQACADALADMGALTLT